MDMKRMLELAGITLTESAQLNEESEISNEVAALLDIFYSDCLGLTDRVSRSVDSIRDECKHIIKSSVALDKKISETGSEIPEDLREAIDSQKGSVRELYEMTYGTGELATVDNDIRNANGDLEDALAKHLDESKRVNEDDEDNTEAEQERTAGKLFQSLEDAAFHCLELMQHSTGANANIVIQIKENIAAAQRQLDRLEI